MARATFDTGSIYNWVSKSSLTERLGLNVSPVSQGHNSLCVAFNGAVILPIGIVHLTWYGGRVQSRRSYVSTFLVADDDVRHFDLLIGSATIVKEKILAWDVGAVWTLISTPLKGRSMSKFSIYDNLSDIWNIEEREEVERQTQALAQERQPLIEEATRYRNEYRARRRIQRSADRERALREQPAIQPPLSTGPRGGNQRSSPRQDNERALPPTPSSSRHASRTALGKKPAV